MGAVKEYLSEKGSIASDAPITRRVEADPYQSQYGIESAHADENGVRIVEKSPAVLLSQAASWRLVGKKTKMETYIEYPTSLMMHTQAPK